MSTEHGERIEGQIIHLNRRERRLFGADGPTQYVARTHGGEAMDRLATQMRRIETAETSLAAGALAGMAVFDRLLFDRRLETFAPVAGAILAHETELYLEQRSGKPS